ncbi:MAG: InlB B-repeat-containing protein [Spirochaetaceae bacterium]|jgi:hypothetical protein|nr:InlB B-repeat-containing protein [Spirochaetaceae bacterium]
MKKSGIGRLIILSGITAFLAASLAGILAGCDFDQIKYDLGIFSPPAVYTVTYKAAGGEITGTPPGPQTVTEGTSIKLAGPGGLAWNDREFTGWLTPEGTKQPGDEYTVTKNTTFYAQWDGVCTLTYDLNGGSGTAPEPVTGVTPGTTVPVAYPEGLTHPDGLVFVAWADGTGDRYHWDSALYPATVTVDRDTILYAQWGCTVTYHANGATAGSPPATVYLAPGDGPYTAASGATLAKNGQAFIGWRLGAGADGDLYVPNDDNAPHKTLTSLEDKAVDGNIDLYAIYMGDYCEGGYVFYAKPSYSEGWRFLAAAPADLEVPGRLIQYEDGREPKDWADRFYFEKERASYDREFYENITAVDVEALTNPAEGAAAIGMGKANTAALNNYTTGNYGGVTIGGSAAYYCDTYVSGNKDDWFLPSIGELKALYDFVFESGNTPGLDTGHGVYWSSNQHYDITKAPDDLRNPNDPKANQAFEAWALRFGESNEGWTGQFASQNVGAWGVEGWALPSLDRGEPSTHSKNALHKVRPVRRF